MNRKHKDMVNVLVDNMGYQNVISVFAGKKDIIKNIYVDEPLSYFNHFNILTQKKVGDRIFYYDKHGSMILMITPDSQRPSCYVNNEKIWLFFNEIMGFSFTEIKIMITDWLRLSHGIINLDIRKLYKIKIKELWNNE